MLVLLIIAFLFLGVQLLTLLSNLLFFPSLKLPINSDARISHADILEAKNVSILIPARDEAENLRETLPRILAQTLSAEVIVLNDQSKDETASILSEFAQTYPNLRVIDGQDLPQGWTGKNWACQQLFELANGSTFIFTDADVRWEKDTLLCLLFFQNQHKAEFMSVWPYQLTVSTLGRITIPIIDQILLASLPYLGVKYLPFGVFSAGNGQLMLWNREAYQKLGGHESFKNELLEDVRMGQAAKAAGLKVALAVGGKVISTRMYHSDTAMLEGFSKNILAASGSKTLLLIAALLNTLSHSLCWLLIPFNTAWLAVALLSLALRALTNLKTGRSLLDTFWQPFMAIPMWLIVGRALSQKSISWKGRSY